MTAILFVLALACAGLGVVLPPLLLPAGLFFCLAVVSGVVRGLGNVVGHMATRRCPFCRRRVPHTARKCGYCAEWIDGPAADR